MFLSSVEHKEEFLSGVANSALQQVTQRRWESPLQEVFKYNLDTILFHVLWEDPGVPSSLTISVILWFL